VIVAHWQTRTRSIEHIPRAHIASVSTYPQQSESCSADDPYLRIVLGCAHEQKALVGRVDL
jgi:hypothetical protein